jgi:hypothetical protein
MKNKLTLVITSLILISIGCSESSNNNRHIINASQRTISVGVGIDRNNVYTVFDIFPGDTAYFDSQYTNGRWDMKTPIDQVNYSYYYGDSIFLYTTLPYKVTKDPNDFDQWKVYFESGTPIPNQCNYLSYLTIRDSDITP